jgi:Dehydrogenases (flavoproteins)
MEKHEVVIVGAGPAGLKAAELLGNAGKDVLVIERDKDERIGDKVCVGVSPPHTMKYFPDKLYERVFSSITLHIRNRDLVVNFDEPLVALISRLDMGQYQLKMARESGAKILANTAVKGLDRKKNEVILKDGERIVYGKLIAADGSNSTIRRQLGFNTNQMVQCIEHLVSGNFEKLELYFDLKDTMTTFWIFPRKDCVSIGTGTFPSMMPASEMSERFNKWALDKGIDLAKAKRRAHPIYLGYHGFKHGNIFLTGDAASFACTVDGEGIYQAIRSGEIAAKAIIDPKWNYKSELKDLGRYHRYGGWIIPWMLVFPKLSRRIVENLGGMFMPPISTIVPLVGSMKFVQRAALGILGK